MINFNPGDGLADYQVFNGCCVDPAFPETDLTLYDIIALPDVNRLQKSAWK